jgi:alkaline phosphatase D
MRPAIPYGVQSGDVTSDRAIVWSRTDRPAPLLVEWSTSDSFRDASRIVGSATLAESDFGDCPPGSRSSIASGSMIW